MKKALTLLLSLALVFSMTACGGKTDTDKDNKNTNQQSSQDKDSDKDKKEPAKEDGEKKSGKITGKELVRNLHARKAIMLALDKKYIEEVILGSGSFAVDYFVPKEFAIKDGKDFREFAPKGWYPHNVEEAKKEWALAKKELGFDTVKVKFTTWDGEGSKKMAEYFQAQMKENLDGLNVIVDQQPFKNKIAKAAKGDFDMEIAAWNPDYPDPMTFLDMWANGNGQNTIGFNNAEYNKIIADCKSGELTKNLDERWKALQRAEEILVKDECAVMPLLQSASSYVQRSTLKNLGRHKFGSSMTFSTATTENVDKDGKHIIHLTDSSDVPTIDPNKASDVVSFGIVGNCMENLVMLDNKDEVRPGVAEKWEVSEDGLKYVFHLRDSKWSNGEPLTAKDFEYSWRRLANPKTGSQYQFMIETLQLKNYAGVIAGDLPLEELGVKAVDNKTLEVELERPVPYFLKTVTMANFAPINQKFCEEKGDKFAIGKEGLLYNGAYILDTLKNGYGYTYAKNPDYWDVKNVKNDGVSFRKVMDASTRVSMYDKNEVDAIGISAEFLDQYQDSPEYHTKISTSNTYILFNVGNDGQKQEAAKSDDKKSDEKKDEKKADEKEDNKSDEKKADEKEDKKSDEKKSDEKDDKKSEEKKDDDKKEENKDDKKSE